ncbi:telomere length and silencing protein 1 homolog isoform X2 [Thalassophryne amazonica]|uniref:telomere length and silencing protein 1 homolog isoform X2 n=1 Tax=Thalassophryne amazonica TaxID=390379 RepID=UPI00147115AA|nr:telomere length and silencing protein 1 homolog isoform X2 [Thalassophryne amazonica]
MPCGKNFRKRKDSSDLEEGEETTTEVRLKVEEAKELQSLRRRQKGVSVSALLVGEKLPPEAELDNDPFKLKTGGVVDMKKIKDRNRDMTDDETELNLGSSFSAETNRRDEDADMMKYIETELKKKKGLEEAEEQKVKVKNAEDHLYELPENIRVNSAKKTEEMLSNQMLSGIPEVDLGIEYVTRKNLNMITSLKKAVCVLRHVSHFYVLQNCSMFNDNLIYSAKIKNIIQTEEAKAKLLAEQRNKKKDLSTSFVPTNIAVNYVQHNRFYHEDANAPQRHHRHRDEPKARPLRVGDTEKPGPEAPSPPNYRKRPNNEKATDDYHYEKFKKMNRRY